MKKLTVIRQHELVSTFSNSSESIELEKFAHNKFDSQKRYETMTETFSLSKVTDVVCSLFDITPIFIPILSPLHFWYLYFTQLLS